MWRGSSPSTHQQSNQRSKVKNQILKYRGDQKSNLGMQECGIQGRSNQKSNLKMHGDVKSNAFVAKKIKM